MIDVKAVSFTINVVGEITGTQYSGTFKVLPILDHEQQMKRNEIARDMLGVKPEAASERAMSQATMFAEVAVRATETPMFWREANNGKRLYDDSVLGAVFDKILETEAEFKADIKKKAEAAKTELATMSTTP